MIRERVQAKREKIKTSSQQKTFEAATFTIEDIDVNQGIRLTGGSLDGYLATLGLFTKDATEKIHEIKRCLSKDDEAL